MEDGKKASPFHCTAEWHFARLTGHGAKYAPLLHNFALHLAKKTGTFAASIPRLAVYFDANEKSVRRALHLLDHIGFLEFVRAENGDTTTYRVHMHTEWKLAHPGKCCERIEMPKWWEEGYDPLAKLLHGISGGRFRPYPNFIKAMRKTGHSEAVIAKYFGDFVQERKPVGRQWNCGLAGAFIKHLRNQQVMPEDPSQRSTLATVTKYPANTNEVPSQGTPLGA